MNAPFSISLRLYFDRQLLDSQLCRAYGPFPYKELGGQSVFIISDMISATIEAQYAKRSIALSGLLKVIKDSDYKGKCVFSVCVRAYEYVPELNFPADMIQAIGSIKAAIDVDLIDMILTAKGDGVDHA